MDYTFDFEALVAEALSELKHETPESIEELRKKIKKHHINEFEKKDREYRLSLKKRLALHINYLKNQEARIRAQKIYNEKHTEEILAWGKLYRTKHKEEINKAKRILYHKKRNNQIKIIIEWTEFINEL